MKNLKFANRATYLDYIRSAAASNREASGLCVWVCIDSESITDVRRLTASSYIVESNWHKLSNGAGYFAPTSLTGIADALAQNGS